MSGATLAEKLALAQISSHLGESASNRQMPIDRVCALGFAPKLGSLLIRLKGANDAPSYNEAKQLIAERLFHIGRRKNWGHFARMLRVADASLHFYILDMCKTCEGRGQLAHSYSGPADEDAGNVCPSCGGSAKASRNAKERATAIMKPGEIPARLAEMLDAADGIVERAARIATGISRWKLYGRD